MSWRPGTKSGYVFVATGAGGTPNNLHLQAEPQAFNQSGTRDFCSDESGVIYYGTTAGSCTQGTNPL